MRTFDHEIQLIGLIEGTDEDGFSVKEEQSKEPILANKLSVRSNEYWQAHNSGVELSVVFEIHPFEYQGEEKLIYESDTYTIVRTYDKCDLIELTCSMRADDHAT